MPPLAVSGCQERNTGRAFWAGGMAYSLSLSPVNHCDIRLNSTQLAGLENCNLNLKNNMKTIWTTITCWLIMCLCKCSGNDGSYLYLAWRGSILSPHNINIGVPQGWVLGPFLFSLVYDICISILLYMLSAGSNTDQMYKGVRYQVASKKKTLPSEKYTQNFLPNSPKCKTVQYTLHTRDPLAPLKFAATNPYHFTPLFCFQNA